MSGPNAIVQTTSGKVQGVIEDGLSVFKGIPFAAPPVGKLRWMPPQPMTPWQGVRPADKFGPICPQDNRPTPMPGRKPSTEPQSEDCLFLNVWTPAAPSTHSTSSRSPGSSVQARSPGGSVQAGQAGKRAVMVWIHGGAFIHGSGSTPNNPGKTLPLRSGVVHVTINYRLGALGFLNLKRITGGKIPSSGNEGFLDQLAALRWVKDNIAQFGGDPDNVTVYGESSGAESIGGLLAMPEKKGLFKKAILQSGASKCQPVERAVMAAERLLYKLGLISSDVDALRALPAEALLKAQLEMAAAGTPGVSAGNLGPVLDGEVLKQVPLDAFEQGSAKDITVIAGSNLEEGKLFALMAGRDILKLSEPDLPQRVKRLVPEQYAAGLIEKYRVALAKRLSPVTPFEVYSAIQGDGHFRMPNIKLCQIQEQLGKPSYGYVFTWKSAAPYFGACHALDVGFVFGNLNDEFHGTGPDAQRLALNMQDAWTAFAKTGDPSCPGLGKWPHYGKERNMMVLGADSRVEKAPFDGQRAAWDGIPNNVLG